MRIFSNKSNKRVETGPIKFNTDWPGLFIRGDDCISLKITLEKIMKGEEIFVVDKLRLLALLDDIDNVLIKSK